MPANPQQNRSYNIRSPSNLGIGDRSSRRKENDSLIGKYRFVRTLGKGNFAKVNLAKHIPTEHLVAIKVIDKTKLTKVGLDKLYREVRMLEKIEHPYIVKLYEVIDRESTLYLAMEYLSGGEIFDYLVAHGRMKERDARAKFRQIVSAVQYCHQKFIVHRDIKAENLLLDHTLNVKLADFGFSNEFCPGKKLDTFCGSPPYAAPELFRGEKYTGPEVDVWSLGVILYTLISGSLPFDGQNLKEVREKVLSGRYRIPFFMSTECEHLIKKLMVQSSSKRPSLETIMNDKWINMGYEDDKLQPFIQPPESTLDSECIAKIVKMGYKHSDVIDSVTMRAYDEISATYDILQVAKESLVAVSERVKKNLNGSMRMIRSNTNGSTCVRPSDPKVKPKESTKPKITNLSNNSTSICTELRGSPKQPFLNNGGYLRSSVYHPKRRPEDSNSKSSLLNQSFKTAIKKIPPSSVPTCTNITRKPTFSKPEKEKSKQSPTKLARGSFIDRIRSSSKKFSGIEDRDKPRALKFTWSMKTMSLNPPDNILTELIRTLGECNIEFEQISKYLLLCVSGSVDDRENFVQWESEVCQLPRVGMHGIKFKRVNGSTIAFKQVGELVTNTLKL